MFVIGRVVGNIVLTILQVQPKENIMAGIWYYSCEEEYNEAMSAQGEADAEAQAYAEQCECEAEQENIEQNNTDTQQPK